MSAEMTPRLADIFSAICEKRERDTETMLDDRLNRLAGLNAIDLSQAIFVDEIMAIQNKLIVEGVAQAILEGIIATIDKFLHDEPLSKPVTDSLPQKDSSDD